jgi:uncharacterized protein
MGIPLPLIAPVPAVPLQAPAESGGIAVTGAGLVLARPDLARLTLAVETKNKDAAAAAKANATRLDAVLRTLKKLGIAEKDIQTSGLEIRSDYEDQKTRVVSNSVEITIRDLKKVGRAVDASLAAGANEVRSLSFEAKDPTPLYDEALRRAVADARRKARVLSFAVKAPVELVSITESGSEPAAEDYSYAPNNRATLLRGAQPGTPIAPNKIEVRASVTLRYRFTDAPQRENG